MICDKCAWWQTDEKLPYCLAHTDPFECEKFYLYDEATKDCCKANKCDKKCECGVDKTGGKHSDWCPKVGCGC